MPSDRQGAFGAAALNARLPMPPGLVGPDGAPSNRRFDIYRNNVVAGLVGALRAAYPVVHRLVGGEFFRAMGAYFVRRDPPASPVLLTYGDSFPDFLAIFDPVAHLPWLPDVARLERARLQAYHAAEASPLRAGVLAQLAPGEFGRLRLTLHPSLRLVASRFAARTIWQANLAPEPPPAIDPLARAEDTLLVRPEAEVLALPLPPGGVAFIAALQQGQPVLRAALDGITATPRFDMAGCLGQLLTARAVSAIDQTPAPDPTKEKTHAVP